MTRQNTAKRLPPWGLAEKRQAIDAAALTVFGRDGYTRASIDAIAAEAGVSTRTIYNHFQDKAELFHTVIQNSSARVAEAQIAITERYLSSVSDLESDLVEFGLAWVQPMITDYPEHFALTRQINAEARHIPRAVIDAWQETGPQRVERELARHMRRFAEQGLLHVEDPQRAAVHFLLLISVANPSFGSPPPSDEELAGVVTSGVRAFLHGYLSSR
jgi:AcrR family transcriptional regulator